MASINALIVTQPTDTVGGVSVLFACSLENVGTSNKMDFFVTHPAYNGGVSKKTYLTIFRFGFLFLKKTDNYEIFFFFSSFFFFFL